MTELSNELRSYYRSVADALPCTGRAKKRYLNDLHNRLCDLQTECPGAGWETACERFGTADEIAESWMENISVHDFKRQVMFSRSTKVVVAVFAALAIMGLILLGRFYLKYREAMAGDFIIYVEEEEAPLDAAEEDLRKMDGESE